MNRQTLTLTVRRFSFACTRRKRKALQKKTPFPRATPLLVLRQGLRALDRGRFLKKATQKLLSQTLVKVCRDLKFFGLPFFQER
jgi:hypothetical protein